ncbi:uncharacterized protein LACBIDRAFT_333990 [Laccaria bicolor S238N-H82]|uniref:Predicted protein n=1 Tax=Laccaria bicolor (strain S238N-H82 / ATCC MYA-4686) TaxID=486041 RepID=B0DXR2_LACBS|nr:uncharacterized protein LACBIDRAFT_333990 [Laccaria bicolor S238N-H82]EDR00659.1 predicted protein [Laccaria bicolor S238N-H82]|eukprot:XP_001888668.1 predicted protein [Laccaria bicolor S238N-H82]
MDEPPSPFFPYPYLPSTGETPDEPPSAFLSWKNELSTDESSTNESSSGESSTDESPSPTDELPSPTDEPPSLLLKSRIPRKTIIGANRHSRDGAIFEHNIYSSGKHEPRTIVSEPPPHTFTNFSLVPIKGNQIVLFANYTKIGTESIMDSFLRLSNYEIRSDNRIGPALWSSNGDWNNFDQCEAISTENPLAITFWARFGKHWKLFDISTTETDASDNFPLIESGRIDFDLQIKELKLLGETHGHFDSGGTNFSFVTRMSIPIPKVPEDSIFVLENPRLVFSANGSKFAIAMNVGRVSVWDIQSKVPLETFIVAQDDYIQYLQFCSGKLGKEVLVFAAVV